MDTYWFGKLLDVLMVQTNSENEKLMILYLDKELRKLKLPYGIDAAGNIIVIKGKAKTYPCVTAHLDTVHSFVDNFKIYKDTDDNDVLFAMDNKSRVGIGGDDKCGIFACLYLLSVIPEIKVVFFSREENGCKGSTAIDKKFFADCRYLIQLDRRGSKDFIQTYWGNKTVSHEFSSEIGLTKKKYKYKNCIGTVTDVMKLWNNKVGVSCINLSCGYYNPHTIYEYVSIDALWHSTKFTEEIINNMKLRRYPSLPPPSTVVKTTTRYQSKYDQCDSCKKWTKESLLWTIQGSNGTEKLCWDCKIDKFSKKSSATLEASAKERMAERKEIISKQNASPNQLGEIVLFACFECGMTTDQMEKGHSLKYATDGHLYCNTCMSVLFASNKNPAMCFVCNKVIPKDHKIIERFGVRVCEECCCPSDIVITDDEVNKKHRPIEELEQEN